MQGRLHRMKLSYLKPRPIHPKADPAAQEAFKKLRRDNRGNPEHAARCNA
jgi:transposase